MAKTTTLKQELTVKPDAPWNSVALTAFNRFVNEPMKKNHVRRAVIQIGRFVELEG
ncbi:MAG: hypothetical protein OER56_02920 [Hyphomicrobiales bacterium]|nr:hypothetical protein [Hyphomicrobiales bacterium]